MKSKNSRDYYIKNVFLDIITELGFYKAIKEYIEKNKSDKFTISKLKDSSITIKMRSVGCTEEDIVNLLEKILKDFIIDNGEYIETECDEKYSFEFDKKMIDNKFIESAFNISIEGKLIYIDSEK